MFVFAHFHVTYQQAQTEFFLLFKCDLWDILNMFAHGQGLVHQINLLS